MRGRPSVWTRTRRLEGAFALVDLEPLVRRLAEEEGVPVEMVLAEAEAMAARLTAAGAVTVEEQCAILAADLGIPPAELRAEAKRILRGMA